MTGRKAIVGLSLLCALFFCAFAAPSALGAKLNTTAVTCKPVEKGAQFSDEHCTKGGEGKGFAHEVIAPFPPETELIGTNEKTGGETKSTTSAVLRFEASEVEIEVVCTGVATHGYLRNETKENKNQEKEMLNKLAKIFGTYTGCTVSLPAGQNCKVSGGVFQTFFWTTSYEKKMAIEFNELSGSITIEGCENASLNGKYPIGGTLLAEPNGTTLNTTAAGSVGTLLVNERPAELVSSVTLRAKVTGKKGEGETIPVSFTTG